MPRLSSSVSLLALALVACAPLAAQSTTTGGILGKVTDRNGNPLAGVQVEITSNQVTRSAVTDAKGGFRVPLLNPGSYLISLSLKGYQTLSKQHVQVSLNEAVTPVFRLAQIQEATVEVISSISSVDTTSTQVGTSFSLDTLEKIPTGRSMESLVYLTPGVVDSGMGSSLFGASISGASGAENAYYIDGVNTTDPRYGGSGTSLVTDFIEQVEVQTGGFKPEYNALGGVINAVTKSGSNEFSGSAWLTWDPRGLAASPKQDIWGNRQSTPWSRYDLGVQVGGALKKDVLFYAVGVDTNISENPSAFTNRDHLSSAKATDTTVQAFGKLNWYVTKDLQLTLFASTNPYSHRQDREVPMFGDGNTAVRTTTGSTAYTLSLDWSLASDKTLSVKLGRTNNRVDSKPVDNTPRFEDGHWYRFGPGSPLPADVPEGSYYIRGGAMSSQEVDANTKQIRADFTWFAGTHQLKIGASSVKSDFWQNSWLGWRVTDPSTPWGIGGYTYSRLNGTATMAPGIRRIQEAMDNAYSESTVQAIYVQDTWEATPGLKVSYGFRAENQKLTDANGVGFLSFGFKDELQPRVGLIWDPSGDGLSKVTANYARYFEVFPLRYGLRYRGGRYLYKRVGIAAGDPGTTYNNATGACTYNDRAFDWSADWSTAYNDPPVQEGIKAPQRNEFLVGYERTLGKWTFAAHANYRKLINPVEDTTPVDANGNPIDKGYQGAGQAVLANPRPGLWRWRTRPDSDSNTVPGQAQWMSWNSSFIEAYNTYKSVDLSIERKTENHFVRLAYTWSRFYGSYEGVVSASNGQIDTNGSMSFDYPILVGTGLLSLDRTHVARLIGSHRFRLAGGHFTFGYNWSIQSGTPLSCMTSDPDDSGGPMAGPWTIPVPRDTAGGYAAGTPVDFRFGQFGRSATTNRLDLRFDYAFKVGRVQFIPSLDIFNALNSRRETGLDNAYTTGEGLNATWGKPTGYQGARYVRGGVKLRF